MAHAEQHSKGFHQQRLAEAATQPDDVDRAAMSLPMPKSKASAKKQPSPAK
jgi:hypothetical protein